MKCKECNQEVPKEIWQIYSYADNEWCDQDYNVPDKHRTEKLFKTQSYEFFIEREDLETNWFWRKKK